MAAQSITPSARSDCGIVRTSDLAERSAGNFRLAAARQFRVVRRTNPKLHQTRICRNVMRGKEVVIITGTKAKKQGGK
jgi:hypothetical protein